MAREESGIIFEYLWIIIIVSILAGFTASLAYYSFVLNVNPACKTYKAEGELLETIRAKANEGGVFEIAPGVYEVYIVGRQFIWMPNEIRLVDPKQVTFYVISEDVIHGFEIAGTNVNFMVFPGYVSVLTWYPPEDLEGELPIICNEYCGIGHQFMSGTLIIERTYSLDGSDDGGDSRVSRLLGELSGIISLVAMPPHIMISLLLG